MTVLVVAERHSKTKTAIAAPAKGSTGRFAARMDLDLIKECGDKDSAAAILETYQEPAIKLLVDDACVARTGAKTLVEQAPVKSKG